MPQRKHLGYWAMICQMCLLSGASSRSLSTQVVPQQQLQPLSLGALRAAFGARVRGQRAAFRGTECEIRSSGFRVLERRPRAFCVVDRLCAAKVAGAVCAGRLFYASKTVAAQLRAATAALFQQWRGSGVRDLPVPLLHGAVEDRDEIRWRSSWRGARSSQVRAHVHEGCAVFC